MTKQISTEQTDANIKEVVRLLAETPVQLERLSKGSSDKQLREPLGKGERSFVQALAHILNCEARTTETIQLALLANEPAFTPIHAERDLGELLQYETLPFDELLAYFKFRRKVLLRVLESLTEKKWSRAVREEGKQRKESVYWQARGQALHELEHVQDLEGKLSRKSVVE
jgi:hypothetical protein